MSAINIPTFFNIDLHFDLAVPGRRFVAFFIDWFIKGGYIALVSKIFGYDIFTKINATLFMFIVFSPFIFYSFIFEWLNKGQTAGKMIMGMKVVNIHGNAPSLSQCAIRWMFLLIDEYFFLLMVFVSNYFFALVGFSPLVGSLFIGITKKSQRVGDIAAATFIVNSKEKVHSIFDTIYSYSTELSANYEPVYPEVIKLSDKDMTIVKKLLESSEEYYDFELSNKLADHLKKILEINKKVENVSFLKQLLKDYNYLSMNVVK